MSVARLVVTFTVEDENSSFSISYWPQTRVWTPAVVKRETVAISGGPNVRTALTVPTGAKVLILVLESADVSLTLKGSDLADASYTGIPLSPATNFIGIPLVLPLGTSPTLYIENDAVAAGSVTAIWA